MAQVPVWILSDEEIIIQTAQQTCSFLGNEEKALRNFENLDQEGVKEIALSSELDFWEFFRSYPAEFTKDLRRRCQILDDKRDLAIKILISLGLYQMIRNGLKMVIKIRNACYINN
jgi:hypothetical protein